MTVTLIWSYHLNKYNTMHNIYIYNIPNILISSHSNLAPVSQGRHLRTPRSAGKEAAKAALFGLLPSTLRGGLRRTGGFLRQKPKKKVAEIWVTFCICDVLKPISTVYQSKLRIARSISSRKNDVLSSSVLEFDPKLGAARFRPWSVWSGRMRSTSFRPRRGCGWRTA